jgi:hypothetical protein
MADPFVADAAHAAAVAAVAASVAARPPGRPLTVRKATRSHLPHTKAHKGAGAHAVDVSALTRILRVDAERRVIVAQGLVSMGALVAEALRHGLVPAVVPELRAFTVAGLINGLGVQSSSHRYGTFPDTVAAFQVVLADGRVVTASPDCEPELYRQLPGSYGTLGIVTAAEVRCVPARPFVRSRYFGVRSADEMQYALACAAGRCDYVDGYMFSRGAGVVVVGDFANAPDAGAESPLWDVTPEAEQYYFQHARDMGAASLAKAATANAPPPPPDRAALTAPGAGDATRSRMSSACAPDGTAASSAVDPAWLFDRHPCTSDTMPTAEYIFRLERGFWWQVCTMVGLPALTETAWGREAVAAAVNAELAALDSSAAAASVTSWSGQSGANPAWTVGDMHRCSINQDCVLRLGRVAEGLAYVAEHLEVWPLWLCPCVVHTTGTAMSTAAFRHVAADEGGALPVMSVDMGVYGEPGVGRAYRHRRDVRALQRFIDAPALWGMCYLSPDEMAGLYDFPTYDAVRARYGAEGAFPHITTKVCYYREGAPDEPPHLLWRLHRRGVREPVLAALAVATAAAGYAGAKAAGWRGLGLRDHARALAGALWAGAVAAVTAATGRSSAGSGGS